MRYFILSFMFISCAQAQIMNMNKPVLCWQGSFQSFMQNMNREYKEELKAYGIANDSKTIIEWYENEDTGTWTIVERKDNYICIISTGDKGGRS